MRLIDADALKEQIENFNCKDCHHYNYVRCRACQIDDALSFIDDAPTVEQPEIVRCRDCKHWDKTTREEGNDCISGSWEDAVCDVFRDWDSYGDLGENFRRTNGDWFCADGERR